MTALADHHRARGGGCRGARHAPLPWSSAGRDVRLSRPPRPGERRARSARSVPVWRRACGGGGITLPAAANRVIRRSRCWD